MAPMQGPCWSTAAVGSGAILTPDTESLGEHLQHCRAGAGRDFALRCGAERLNGFVAARCISTLLLAAAVAGGGAWLLLAW